MFESFDIDYSKNDQNDNVGKPYIKHEIIGEKSNELFEVANTPVIYFDNLKIATKDRLETTFNNVFVHISSRLVRVIYEHDDTFDILAVYPMENVLEMREIGE